MIVVYKSSSSTPAFFCFWYSSSSFVRYSFIRCLFGVSVNPKYLRSSLASLYNDNIIMMITKLNGSAAVIAEDCSASRPVTAPERRKTYAMDDIATPHSILQFADG